MCWPAGILDLDLPNLPGQADQLWPPFFYWFVDLQGSLILTCLTCLAKLISFTWPPFFNWCVDLQGPLTLTCLTCPAKLISFMWPPFFYWCVDLQGSLTLTCLTCPAKLISFMWPPHFYCCDDLDLPDLPGLADHLLMFPYCNWCVDLQGSLTLTCLTCPAKLISYMWPAFFHWCVDLQESLILTCLTFPAKLIIC